MTEEEILKSCFIKAVKIINSDSTARYPKILTENTDILIENIDRNKSLISALVTSLLKKIIAPE